LRRPRLLLPYLVLAAAEASVLVLLASFHRAPQSGVLVPLFRWVGGEKALHYPEAFSVLPTVFERLELALALSLAALCQAVVVAALPALFLEGRLALRAAARLALRRAPAVWAVTLPAWLPVTAAALARDRLAGGLLAEQPDVLWFAGYGLLGLALMGQALMGYGLAAALLGRLPVGAALARSVRLASRSFWTSLGFALGPTAILYPLRVVESDVARYFHRIPPEAVVLLAGGAGLVSLLAHHVRAAALARFYLHWCGTGEEAP
jgi:hypothetical protein